MIAHPIFIVGTERSGSNLLRLILNAHPSISIPHPPHLFRDLHPLLSRYGDLSDDRHFKRLIADAVRLVELHFAPWAVRLDANEIFLRTQSAKARNLYCIYAEIHEQHLRSESKRRWGCKSTFMIRHIDEIVSHHRAPRIVHLVRDGRDVACSARDSVFSHFHPHYVSRLWSDEQREALRWKRRLGPEVFLTLRYEDLISDSERQIRGVCEFLNEEYDPRMLRFFESEPASKLANLSRSWENVARPIMRDNSGRFHTQLTEAEIFEFERISFRELRAFDYMLENEIPSLLTASPKALDRLGYFLSEKARSSKVNLEALVTDRNALLRMRKKLFLSSVRWL